MYQYHSNHIHFLLILFFVFEFDGDIYKWDVCNVADMESMFCNSVCNQDISNWDVSNISNMEGMFYSSKFNCDISNWDVSNVVYKSYMFDNCQIEEKFKPKFKK